MKQRRWSSGSWTRNVEGIDGNLAAVVGSDAWGPDEDERNSSERGGWVVCTKEAGAVIHEI